ncbi:hypothetical protein MTP02_50720 [Streptomyces albus]|nr:hypothetical protein MTP02_50720 [Streptomyces albus]
MPWSLVMDSASRGAFAATSSTTVNRLRRAGGEGRAEVGPEGEAGHSRSGGAGPVRPCSRRQLPGRVSPGAPRLCRLSPHPGSLPRPHPRRPEAFGVGAP